MISDNPAMEEELAEVRVVVAKKLRNGGVILEFNLDASATRIKFLSSLFTAKLVGTSILHEREFPVMAEFVPVTHENESAAERRAIECDFGLPIGGIASTKWIKPVARRHDTQTMAHLLLRFSTAESANLAIRDGLIIQARRVSAHRPESDPQRCMKCQLFDSAPQNAPTPTPVQRAGTVTPPRTAQAKNLPISDAPIETPAATRPGPATAPSSCAARSR